MMSRLTIIVAATHANGIGRDSLLPWRLPKEMKYFARVTTNAPEGHYNAVIMGRNTWESIPQKNRPLVRRVNIVMTRNKDYRLEPSSDTTPSYSHSTLASALGRLANVGSESKPVHRAFIIGGASLYSEVLGLSATTSSSVVDRILLTRIISPEFDCDVFMPDFLKDQQEDGSKVWGRATHEALEAWVGFDVPEGEQEENGVKYEFQMWVREF